MPRIDLNGLTPEVLRVGGEVVAIAPGHDEAVALRRQLQLPQMVAADSPGVLTPERIELELRDLDRESLEEARARLAELGFGCGLEPLPEPTMRALVVTEDGVSLQRRHAPPPAASFERYIGPVTIPDEFATSAYRRRGMDVERSHELLREWMAQRGPGRVLRD